jgi:penicillin-binding protein-related factor A (putative recombinase)
MTYANRGKEAEGLVKRHLTKLSEQSHTTFYRFPDARAGSLQTAPADFMLVHVGRLILLEVKEVNHSYRLPHGNLTQVPKLRRFEMAGAVGIVLVYFKPEKAWRVAPVDYFLETSGGSWDMREIPLKSLADCIKDVYENCL